VNRLNGGGSRCLPGGLATALGLQHAQWAGTGPWGVAKLSKLVRCRHGAVCRYWGYSKFVQAEAMARPRRTLKLLGPRRNEEGFSLALAVLVLLGGLFTTLAITSRTIGSRQVRDSDDKSFSARNAAEIGMTRIISELNRPRNRRLLVNAPQLGATGRTVSEIESDDSLRNACNADGEAADINSFGSFNSGTVLNNEVTVPNTNGRLRYTLIAINNGNPANNFFEQDAAGNANDAFSLDVGSNVSPFEEGESGEITLDVRGRVVDNGAETSRYNLRKTFAVIPKCCGGSFGGSNLDGTPRWGNDTNTSSCGVASGYGLILGARRDLTDSNTKGSLSTRLAVLLERTVGGSTTETNVSRVYCTVPTNSPVASDCPLTSSVSIVRTSLTLKNILLPPVPFPESSGSFAFAANQPTVSTSGANNTQIPSVFRSPASVPGYARMRVCDAGINSIWSGADTRSTQAAVLSTSSSSRRLGCRFTVPNDEILETRNFSSWQNAAGNTLKWHLGRLCRQATWGGVANTIYCNLDSLQLQSATITFDTAGNSANTSIPIVLTFSNGGSAASDIKDIISTGFLSGTSTLRQINTRRPSPRLEDMSIYGCAINQSTNCRFQRIRSNSLGSLNLANIFVYAPYATMQADFSLLAFRGAFWGNKLSQTISGSSFIIPSGSIDSVVNSFPNWTPSQLDLEQDYVARSVIRVGTFSD
jgi:hypothetical protein